MELGIGFIFIDDRIKIACFFDGLDEGYFGIVLYIFYEGYLKMWWDLYWENLEYMF